MDDEQKFFLPKPVSEREPKRREESQLGTHGQNIAKGNLRPRVTIKDLAEALGVTKGTVSRALNDYPDIAPATRKRIQRQADRMGYRPLAQAQAIRTGRSQAIGLVIQTDIQGAQRPFLANFLEGVTRAASAEGWTLTVATAAGEEEMVRTLGRLIDERKADGFILPRTYTDDARMHFLREAGVPFVLYGRVPDPEGCAWFDIRGEKAMQSATERLAALGHTRIAFVNGGSEYNFAGLRYAGYQAGLEAAGIAFDEGLVRSGAMLQEQGASAATSLMAMDHPPTAIVYAVDAAALGAYDAAERLGLEIGSDLSVIGYDGIPECRWVRPPLTTFSVDSCEAGARLSALLIALVRGSSVETLRETRDAKLQIGGSDGPPRLTSEALAEKLAASAA